VFSLSILARAFIGLGLAACAACAVTHPTSEDADVPQAFYTVTAEIALARHQPRTAALQYAAAAASETDVGLLARATQVAAESLQPSLAEKVAARWAQLDPKSVEAQRAAAQAALALDKIDQASMHYRRVLDSSPTAADAEFAALEGFSPATTIFLARVSWRIVWLQGFHRLRPLCDCRVSRLACGRSAAAVRSFTAALALPAAASQKFDEDARRALLQTLARAQIMAGDTDRPLAQHKRESSATKPG